MSGFDKLEELGTDELRSDQRRCLDLGDKERPPG